MTASDLLMAYEYVTTDAWDWSFGEASREVRTPWVVSSPLAQTLKVVEERVELHRRPLPADWDDSKSTYYGSPE